MKDFFVSYNRKDETWAEWIAWTLEEAGFSTVIQAWDFRPGGDFVMEMQKATTGTRKTIAVLSESYLVAEFAQPEWGSAFARDPLGNERTLIPVRVQRCQPTGLLRTRIFVDLVGLSETDAKQKLIVSLSERGKPPTPPIFPGATRPPFPGSTGVKSLNALLAEEMTFKWFCKSRVVEVAISELGSTEFLLAGDFEEMRGTFDDWLHRVHHHLYEANRALTDEDPRGDAAVGVKRADDLRVAVGLFVAGIVGALDDSINESALDDYVRRLIPKFPTWERWLKKCDTGDYTPLILASKEALRSRNDTVVLTRARDVWPLDDEKPSPDHDSGRSRPPK